MKRFKKVLALVLAGVLALAMLTACDGTTDPDKVIPEDGVSPSVVLPSMMCCSKIPVHTIWQTESVWRLSKRKMAQFISWSACSM